MKAGDVHKFNCTECGVGLDALGGGRVTIHICSYCGAELDAQDDYKVLSQHRDMVRPDTPFELGMTGDLWGVEFTVIGTMAWAEFYEGKRWAWVDHQVYSPTHGYAWLTVDKGHVTFTRKTRDLPSPSILSPVVIETSEQRPSLRFQGETFRYFSSGKTSPTFIEGAFNFQPSMDAVVNYVELMGGERMLAILEDGQHEREYEVTTLPDRAALFESFGIPAGKQPRARGTHALDALDRSPLQRFVRNLALVGCVAALIIGIGVAFKGEQIASHGRHPVTSEITLPFQVTNPTGLTEVTITANANNSWGWFEAELTDADDETIAAFERGIEYYTGSDWKEGSRSGRTRLKLAPGEYTLYLSMAETQVDWTNGRPVTTMSARVRQGVANPMWLWGTAAVLGLFGFFFLGERILRHNERWSGSDWSDD